MKIILIHGQNHKGSTYTVAAKLAEMIKKKAKEEVSVSEFFLPRDFDEPCMGCATCFMTDLTHCSHFEKLKPISDAILAADILIFDSPVYALHASGQMMSFLDHLCTWWIVHRPRVEMTQKQAVVIATAAGGGLRSAGKDIMDSLQFWGVRKMYRLGFAVQAIKPSEIPDKIRNRIEKETDSIAAKLISGTSKRGMNLKGKLIFFAMRFGHKHMGKMEPDYGYWEKHGWHGNKRPWKD